MTNPEANYSNNPSTGSKQSGPILQLAATTITFAFVLQVAGAEPIPNTGGEVAPPSGNYNVRQGFTADQRFLPILPSEPPDRRGELLLEIERLEHDCRESNWDGEDADPVSSETLEIARSFVDQLSDRAISEDLFLEASPYGDIEFEWVPHDDVMLTIIILTSGEIGVSYWISDDRGTSREPWEGTIPDSASDAIRRMLNAPVVESS